MIIVLQIQKLYYFTLHPEFIRISQQQPTGYYLTIPQHNVKIYFLPTLVCTCRYLFYSKTHRVDTMGSRALLGPSGLRFTNILLELQYQT